jgi:hypothetical protein
MPNAIPKLQSEPCSFRWPGNPGPFAAPFTAHPATPQPSLQPATAVFFVEISPPAEVIGLAGLRRVAGLFPDARRHAGLVGCLLILQPSIFRPATENADATTPPTTSPSSSPGNGCRPVDSDAQIEVLNLLTPSYVLINSLPVPTDAF